MSKKRHLGGHFERNFEKVGVHESSKVGDFRALSHCGMRHWKAAPLAPKNKDKLGRKGIITPTADQFQVLKEALVG